MSRLVVGVIGHVDHGKTALVRALTGQETDRLAEEKARGISIALGFAHLEAGGGTIDLIDMPGHERFVRTMIAGATGIDAVLLVVAANEGIKPQTVEHVEVAGLLGLRRAVVAVTKCDLVAREEAERTGEDARMLLFENGIIASDLCEVVFTSAERGEGIAELRAALAALTAGQQPRPADGLAFLPIDRAFAMTGHGPVVTGTLRGAEVAAGDALELLPARRPVRVRSVQVHGEKMQTARPGQRVALNLRGVEIAQLERGMALAAPDTLAPSEWLTVAIRSVPDGPPLKNGASLRALLGTDEVGARLRLLDRDLLEPGDEALAQLRCTPPVALPAGEAVILRLPSPARTVAGGRVLEAETRRRKRHDSAALARLADLRDLAPPALIAAEAARAGPAGTSLTTLSRLTALAPWRVAELLHPLAVTVTRSGLVVRAAELERLATRIPALLRPQPEGLTPTALRAALPRTGAAVLDEALARLVAAGAIAKRGSRFLIPRPDEDRARARGEADLAARIAQRLRQAGLAPPRPSEIVTDPASHRAVEELLRDGVLIRAVDRAKRKEILFHRDAIAEARRRLAPLLAPPGLLATEIGAALGISRKYTMPLLDHFDTIRFTRRDGDRRVAGGRG